MKLRISSSKLTAFRKDITRFAPAWALYLIGGLLVMLTVTGSSRADSAANALAATTAPLAIVNIVYAGLCAQLLFGDLFNARLCNAVHSLPMRREHWFLSHVIAGLCYSLVPNLIGVICMLPNLGEFWYVGFLWLLGMELHYLFFFGLGVFSVFCTGNRFAMAAVYAILNFASLIVYWFVMTIYEPMLYGVKITEDIFFQLCPVAWLVSEPELIRFEFVKGLGGYHDSIWEYRGLGEGWGYLAVIAVIGVALMGAALLMYRRRKLESAGDFIAVKPLAPIFSVVFTLCAGAVFSLFAELVGIGMLPFLIIGMVVGFFTGQMLLSRTVKVFKKKAFLGLILIALAMGLSIFLTKIDAFGIVRYVPEAEQVAMVQVDAGSDISKYSNRYLELTEQADIEKILQAHEDCIENRDQTYNYYTTMIFQYTLKNGRTVSRVYRVGINSEAGKILSSFYNKPEAVLGYTDWAKYLDSVEDVFIEGNSIRELMGKEEVCRLLEAIKADCEAGDLDQIFGWYHYGKYDYVDVGIEIKTVGDYRYLSVFKNSENTIAWLKTYQAWIKERGGTTVMDDIFG